MSDIKAGLSSSEGKLTFGGVLGLLGTGLTLAVQVVQDPTIPWYGKVTVVALILLTGVAGQMGWTNARTNLKIQELQAKALEKLPADAENPSQPPQG